MTEHAHVLRMLDAARTLHERDPSDPQYCTTCGDINTATGRWPCTTATALGATGRSEWLDTPAKPTPDAEPAVEQWPNHRDPCPEASITGISDKRCIQHRGHAGPCFFAWLGDHTPCLAPKPGTASFCSLGEGHTRPHTNLNGVDWPNHEDTE